ncbi:MAG: nitrous oxide reductase accessory protein NosL [Proteobacteria bacterium]|nr:nitrous oxide reductase accessory protein NosL [Pseudomonadota bacterium]
MTHPAAARRMLLGASALCVAAAAGLFWQYAHRPAAAFAPPAEDVCIVPPSRQSAAHPYDPASGLEIFAARPVPADARCPVCGMYPARFAKWAAQVIFDDGSAHFFDSPVDLFMFLAEPARFDASHSPGQAAALYVSDFNGSGWTDARAAAYVLGSSARGPMRGPDLPAFADEAAARRFATERGGHVLRFADIRGDTLAGLRDATHSSHMH